MTSEFVAYVGPPDLHDGTILRVESTQDTVTVLVESYERRRFALEFHGVTHQEMNAPEGMVLYALIEMRTPPPRHKYVFANWEYDDPARLEIEAEGFDVMDIEQRA
ncbi:MAG: hypothetical protein ACHRXM_00680 [Isosphaerales bacterium]